MNNVISTHHHRPSLVGTLKTIGVCALLLLADFITGVRGVSRVLWANYRLACAEQRAFEAANPVARPMARPAPRLSVADESCLPDSGVPGRLARGLGRLTWLWLMGLALLLGAVLIDLVGGWPLLVDAAGRALVPLLQLLRLARM